MAFEVRSPYHIRDKSPGDGIDDGSRRLGKRTWFLLLTTIVLSMIACYQYGVFNVDWSWRSPKKAEVIIAEAAEPVIPDLRASQPQLTPELAVVPKATPAVTPAPIRTEKVYVVQPGDVLSRTFPKDWQAVCETNNLKDCSLIYAGQELRLPGTVEASQMVRKPVERLADGSLPIARLNVAPYRSYTSAEKDRQILESQGYTSDEIVEYFGLVSSGGCVAETFGKGTRFPWMSFGNAKVVKNLVAVWHEPEVGKVCQLSSGRNVVVLEKCGNLTEVPSRPVIAVSVPPEPSPEPDDAPVLPVHAKEGDVIPCNLQAGAGVYQNRVYQGVWGYGEGICYIFKNGEWQHGPGFYAMAGGGESRVSTYSNKERGFGLQYGVQRNWLGDRGPATFELKARWLLDHMWGSNKEGYWVDQKGQKFGLYGSYYERHGDNLVGAIGEYWQSFGSKVKSSWSGQQAQDRGSVGVYGVYEHPLGDSGDWRLRWIAGVQHTNWDQQNWFRLTPEFRYQEWLMFGPQVAVPIGISAPNQPLTHGDLTTVGAFVRVELGTEIRRADAEQRAEQVEYVPAGEAAMPIHPGALAEALPREVVAPAE
jgi:LysM repeat protein